MWSEFINFLIWYSWVIKFNLISYCWTAARLEYSRKHESRNLTYVREHDIVSCWDHMTNQNLYKLTDQVPLRETIRKYQLTVSDSPQVHRSLYPTVESANQFFIYEPRITFLTRCIKDDISKSNFVSHFVVSKKRKPPDRWWWLFIIFKVDFFKIKFYSKYKIWP